MNEDEMIECHNCFELNYKDDEECSHCGTLLDEEKEREQ